jgi:AAT family amino acid transporter
MAYFPDTRIALMVGPAWLILLTVLYYALGLAPKDKRDDVPQGYEAGWPAADAPHIKK